ncbi:CoA-binding protein [Desulfovibrio sp. SGI.169]|uniref:CoA-binding protein n=1 Tax=Desulfovibrio sp. SGI.169 TaxID=3420561 RepID=UPI003CFDEFE6
MPDDTSLRALLRNAKSIAILGAKDTPGQPVDRVGRYLLEQGYAIWPVHPVRRAVWGLTAFPHLAALPGPADIIDVFRAPRYCPEHAREILALPWRPQCFWMQAGIASPEARELLEAAGARVVENACLMVEHARLLRGTAEQQA